MSGLIWAGIGKGIADAGTTFGSYMLKDIEDQRRRDDEERREANAIKRAEEADRIRAEREEKKAETLKQRVTTETAQVEQRATQIGTERRTARLDSDATRLGEMSAKAGEEGDIALSKEQMLDLIRKDPALRESYRKSGLIEGAAESTRDPRMIAAEDRVTAAMGIGAHSSVLDAYTKARKDTLDEIRRENEQKRAEAAQAATDLRLDQQGRKTDALIQYLGVKGDAVERNAETAEQREARLAKGGGGKGSGSGRGGAPTVRSTKTDSNGDEIAIMSDGTTKNLGIKSAVFDSRVANTISAMEKSDYNFRQLPEEEKRKRAVERLAGGPRPASTPAPSPSSSSNRPPLNSFVRN
jgi:hypothetical protein